MANLIDSTYFIGEIDIPNKSGAANLNTAIQAHLTRMISIYEPEFLTELLGSILYSQLLAGLAAPGSDTRWTLLKAQLLNTTKLTSQIANYVYFKYANEMISRINPVDAPSDFNVIRSVNAWNEMVKMNISVYEYITDNIVLYPAFIPEFTIDFTKLFRPINTFGI